MHSATTICSKTFCLMTFCPKNILFKEKSCEDNYSKYNLFDDNLPIGNLFIDKLSIGNLFIDNCPLTICQVRIPFDAKMIATCGNEFHLKAILMNTNCQKKFHYLYSCLPVVITWWILLSQKSRWINLCINVKFLGNAEIGNVAAGSQSINTTPVPCHPQELNYLFGGLINKDRQRKILSLSSVHRTIII